MALVRRLDRRARTARPVRANLGIEAAYRRRMTALVDEMAASVEHWVAAAFRKNPPVAQDELPAATLERALKRLARRWNKRFDEAAPALAEYFAKQAARRSRTALKKILRDGGFSVKFSLTRAQEDILAATVAANVALIKSIPEKYLADVEGAVMRSVAKGGDLGPLARELREAHGVTKRRAALIARDQNRKATAYLSRARQLEVGITRAVWVHSGGGKEPRPSHVKAGREGAEFDLAKGWYDPDERLWILPGELINCRCVARPVVPGYA